MTAHRPGPYCAIHDAAHPPAIVRPLAAAQLAAEDALRAIAAEILRAVGP